MLQKLTNWQLWVCSKLSQCQVKIKKSKFQRKFEKFKSFLQFLNFYLTPPQLWTNPQLSVFELFQHMRDEKIFSGSTLFIFVKNFWLCLFSTNISYSALKIAKNFVFFVKIVENRQSQKNFWEIDKLDVET